MPQDAVICMRTPYLLAQSVTPSWKSRIASATIAWHDHSSGLAVICWILVDAVVPGGRRAPPAVCLQVAS